MREIYFRGKDEWGNWREGDLIFATLGAGQKPMIMDAYDEFDLANNMFEVAPETVGQYTGLKDCEGREIYEGDVIRSDLLPHMRTTVCNGCVEYRNGAFYVEYIDHTYANLGDLIFYSGTSSTVIGNIHDNPELLERKP